MAIIAKEPENTGGDFIPAPAGIQQAVCVDVVDDGIVERTWSGETKKQHEIRIKWQLSETLDNGTPFLVQKRYTLSLHEKATLRKDLRAWRGKEFTEEELAGFDVEKVIGANCMLTITHTEKNGKTYANVEAIAPLMKNLAKLAPDYDSYTREKDRPSDAAPANAGGDGAPAAKPQAAPKPQPQPAGDFDFEPSDELPF